MNIQHVLKHPDSVIKYIFNDIYLTEMLGKYYHAYYGESDHISKKITRETGANLGRRETQKDLYAITRLMKPGIVIETGVARGISSRFILEAMKQNRKGRLISIDFPSYKCKESVYNLTENEIGQYITNGLKDRWQLILGKSSEIIPKLLNNNIWEIDIFIHDSLHTYENMLWEFTTVWPRIKNGGLLLSHDTDRNDAFLNFVNGMGKNYTWTRSRGYGIIKKGIGVKR